KYMRISMKKSFVSILFLLFFEISTSYAGWSEEGEISYLGIHSGNAISTAGMISHSHRRPDVMPVMDIATHIRQCLSRYVVI
ncbi:MAG: hypothetical protein RPU13_03575, partial [Candidatus Sedimenticola sp. (ex Thyasira tokunagai)]